MRTNNSAEGGHAKLNRFMQVSHPTLWRFIDTLRRLDESIYSDVRQWENGQTPGIRTWYRVQQRKVAVCRQWGQLDPITYLRAIGSTLKN